MSNTPVANPVVRVGHLHESLHPQNPPNPPKPPHAGPARLRVSDQTAQRPASRGSVPRTLVARGSGGGLALVLQQPLDRTDPDQEGRGGAGGGRNRQNTIGARPGARAARLAAAALDDTWLRAARAGGHGAVMQAYAQRLLAQAQRPPSRLALLGDQLALLAYAGGQALDSGGIARARERLVAAMPAASSGAPTPWRETLHLLAVPLLLSWQHTRSPAQVRRARACLLALFNGA